MRKREIERVIYDVLQNTLDLDVRNINRTDNLANLKVDGDDWSFLFIPEVEGRLGVSIPFGHWHEMGVFTVQRTAEMLQDHIKTKSSSSAP